MKKIMIIAFLALLFTPVTEVAMPNPAAPFHNFRQMIRYFKGLEDHGLKGHMVPVEVDQNGELFFERDGKRCRM